MKENRNYFRLKEICAKNELVPRVRSTNALADSTETRAVLHNKSDYKQTM